MSGTINDRNEDIAKVPECVTRWREMVKNAPVSFTGQVVENKYTAHPSLVPYLEAAHDVLHWLATTPNPAAIVAASSNETDVTALAGWVRNHRAPTESAWRADALEALSRATILDRDELVAWLREMAPHAVALGLREWWAGLPAALRVLLDGEDS